MKAAKQTLSMRAPRAARLAVQAVIAIALCGSALAQAGPAKPDPAEVDRGKRIYTQNCARCHGINMVSAGAGFFDLRKFPVDEKPRFVKSVNEGLRAMPAWKEKFKPEELESLWAYVISHQVK